MQLFFMIESIIISIVFLIWFIYNESTLTSEVNMTYQDVLKHYATPERIAADVEVSVQTVAKWKKSGKVPKLYQLAIQTLTKNKLKAD